MAKLYKTGIIKWLIAVTLAVPLTFMASSCGNSSNNNSSNNTTGSSKKQQD
ncbi:MAG: hypothetical protein K1W15_06660 [Lachnospiraceae bacterium]